MGWLTSLVTDINTHRKPITLKYAYTERKSLRKQGFILDGPSRVREWVQQEELEIASGVE
jgi:hypothetical protein